ncbi:MAG: hypothetical protein HYX26_07230, partial [Acidobacteriales bacterium]|nr:hypothetical protein [Terriglobales bacterium]
MRLFPSPGESKQVALRLGASLVFIYVSLCAFLYVQQRHFVFVPSREIEATPRDSGCAYDDVRIG